MFKIVEREQLNPEIVLIKVKAPVIANKARPGQFVILRVDETGERIPLTIAGFDQDAGLITIIFQMVGKTTCKLATLKTGEAIHDLVGPLGKPSPVKEYGTVVCVAGGLGAAIVLPVAEAMKKAGNKVITILGARTKDLLLLEAELGGLSDNILIMTDDGSKGRGGFVTDALKEVLDEEEVDLVVAIGPAIMMKCVCDVTKPVGVRTMVSLNSIMVDGTGMCGSCRVEVGGKTKFACVDGPDFDGHQVDFNLLMARQKVYLDEEKQALEEYRAEG